MDGVRLDPRDMWFEATRDPRRPAKLHLTLFVPGWTQQNEHKIAGASMLVLDMALGEFDVETRIGGIETKPVPPSPGKAGLRPLTELAAVVDAAK